MNFANKISTFRILSVPFFLACLIYYSPEREFLRLVAVGIFILGVVSDALDGYIARKTKQQTKAGMILDPLGDKLLMMTSYICLALLDKFALHIPLWVSLIVISRDIILLLGALVIYIVKQNIAVFPSKWGKFTTVFQMSTVLLVLLQWRFSFIFWWIAAILTVISGMDYVMKGFKILYALDNHRNNN